MTIRLTTLLTLGLALPAWAGQKAATPLTPAATYKEECASCHVPYPARLLPAESWRALMAGLPSHFGTNAALDAPTASVIERFLVANASMRPVRSTAADSRPGAGPVLRITETRWFLKEHREVPARKWASPEVKSKANCAACHTGAERGNFDDGESGSGGGRRP
ncbi:MAG: diheme cytochrome c [Vicinamibacterales bacterium]